jgi:hypothetical protein
MAAVEVDVELRDCPPQTPVTNPIKSMWSWAKRTMQEIWPVLSSKIIGAVWTPVWDAWHEVISSHRHVRYLSPYRDEYDPLFKLSYSRRVLKIRGVKNDSFPVEHTNHILCKWCTSRNRTLSKHVYFADKVVCLRWRPNTDPLHQNVNKQQLTEK